MESRVKDSHSGPPDQETPEREPRSLLVFKAGGHLLSIAAHEAYEAVSWREPAPLPRAPQGVLGIVSIRGRMFTLLNSRALLGARIADGGGEEEEEELAHRTCAFIIPLRGAEQLALTSDEAPRAVEIEDAGPIILLETTRLFEAAMRGAERRRRRF